MFITIFFLIFQKQLIEKSSCNPCTPQGGTKDLTLININSKLILNLNSIETSITILTIDPSIRIRFSDVCLQFKFSEVSTKKKS